MREISWGEEKKDPPKKKEKEKKYRIAIDYGNGGPNCYYRNCSDVVQRENSITFYFNGEYKIIPYYRVFEIELALEKF